MKIFLLSLIFVCVCVVTVKCEEPHKGYRCFADISLGDAYNLNTAQTISINNMQWYCMISTTHGYYWKNWFVGVGVGYYHSYRDRENIYPIYVSGRYTFIKTKAKPYIEARTGIMYDPLWIEKVQKYGTLGTGVNVYEGLQAGMRLSVFSRPSRYFTANAAIVLSYVFGK